MTEPPAKPVASFADHAQVAWLAKKYAIAVLPAASSLRALLVSRWAVSSDAAVALTTRMFDESSKGGPKVEALRHSMLALMASTDQPYFAQLALWAPFVVVGKCNVEWNVRRRSSEKAQTVARGAPQAAAPGSRKAETEDSAESKNGPHPG